jgi:ABC-type transport system involved in multi-copper enzyme maturation permease subunit
MSSFLSSLAWNPIVSKELRSRMRGRHAAALLTAYLSVIGGIGYLVYASDVGNTSTVLQSGTVGSGVFAALAGSVIGTVVLVVPGLVGPAISGERERQTLDLLLVTPLCPARIVVGKLLAALTFVAFLVIACMPLFSVSFLLGGVALSTVLLAVSFTMVTALALGSVAILVSAALRRPTASSVVSYVLMLVLVAGPLIGGYAWSRVQQPADNGGGIAPPLPALTLPAGANATGTFSTAPAVVESISPAMGAVSLLASNACGSYEPYVPLTSTFFPIGSCSTSGQYLAVLGPFGTWPIWEATMLFDGIVALGALGASVLVMRRREGS